MRAGVLVRAGVALVAIVVVAWLVVMERDANLLGRGHALSKRLTQADNVACARSPGSRPICKDFTRAVSYARRSRFLNPDSEPDLFHGVLANSGRWRQQSAAIRAVLRNEPDNLSAWTALLLVNRGHDNVTVQLALANLHRLDPLDVGSP
jgi:hypothetical protein